MKLDIHVHTRYSDGANTIDEIVAHAKKIGLDGIAITDHNTVEGIDAALEYDREGFKVIPGIEVSAKEGHIIGLNVREEIGRKQSAEKTVERIHELGGIAIAAHPYDRIRPGVGKAVYCSGFDALEVINGHTILESSNVSKIADELGLPKVGGSDAHSIHELGSVCIITGEDPLESILKGEVRIKANINKLNVLKGMVQRRFWRLI